MKQPENFVIKGKENFFCKLRKQFVIVAHYVDDFLIFFNNLVVEGKLDKETSTDLLEVGPSQTTCELVSQLRTSAMNVSRNLKELGKTKK